MSSNDIMGYTILPNDVLENIDLNMQEQSLLIALLTFLHREKGFAYPSYEKLKLRSKIRDNRTLIKNVNSLIEKKLIRKETSKGKGCKYYINLPSGELHHVENYTTCKNTLPPSGELHDDLVENYTTTNTNTNTNTNINIYSEQLTEEEIEEFKKIQSRVKKEYKREDIKEEFKKVIELGLNRLETLKVLESNLKNNISLLDRCKKKIESKDISIQRIFDFWNSKNIINHKELKEDIKKAIIKSLGRYEEKEILKAMQLYSEVIQSKYRFNYKWSLKDFLNRSNGISSFMEEGTQFNNYMEWKKKGANEYDGYTKGCQSDYKKRFTEGTEEIEFKREEPRESEFTEEDYERMYESGELI